MTKTFRLIIVFFWDLGGLYLVSCGTNITRLPLTVPPDNANLLLSHDISVNGSSISAGNRLQSLCDVASLQQFKRLHLTKHSTNETVLSSASPSTPK